MSYVKLGQIARITNGKRNAQDAVENGAYPLFDRSVVIKRSDKYLFDKEALIVAGEGKTFIPRYYNGKFDLHQRCYAIFDFDPNYDIKYVFYYIKWNQPYFQGVYTGSTVPSLRLGNFTEMPIKEYSLKKQTQIQLELGELERAIDLKKKDIFELNELIKSRFIEMFGNVEKTDSLENLTTKITDGSHLPPKGIEHSEYLMLSSQNVHDELLLDDVRYLTKEDFDKENKRTSIQEGDVLLTIVGTIGRTHVVKNNEKYVFQRSVGVLKPKKDVLNGVFLASFLKTPAAIEQLESGGHGTSQKGIYLADLKKLRIPLVKYDEQIKYAEFVKLIDKSKFIVQKQIEDLQELLNKKMDEYFGSEEDI